MKVALETDRNTYYSHEGAYYMVFSESRLTPEEIQERILNTPKYLSPYRLEPHEGSTQPIRLYQFLRGRVEVVNMNLYEYDRVVKGREEVSVALNYGTISVEDDTLSICCSRFLRYGYLDSKKEETIRQYVREHERELLADTFTNKIKVEVEEEKCGDFTHFFMNDTKETIKFLHI